jgi:hypothetical protein
MKSFKEYLVESQEEKIYSFKLKVAGELPDNFEDVVETCLKKYECCKFSKSKTVPIQENLPDFPDLKNLEVSVFDVDCKYPTTSTVLTSYIAEHTGVPVSFVKVRSLKEEEAAEVKDNPETAGGKALIGQCDFPKENHQGMVGEKHVSAFLKELAKERKKNEPQQYKGVNDQLLAKKAHKEKANEMAKPGPAKSALKGLTGRFQN